MTLKGINCTININMYLKNDDSENFTFRAISYCAFISLIIII